MYGQEAHTDNRLVSDERNVRDGMYTQHYSLLTVNYLLKFYCHFTQCLLVPTASAKTGF